MIKIESARLKQKTVQLRLSRFLNFDVDPTVIQKTIRKEFKVANDLLQNVAFFEWFVIGGNWDTKYGLFRDERNYSEILDLVLFKNSFRNSKSYNRCVVEWQNGTPQKGFDGLPFQKIEDIDDTFDYYLNLISSMTANGYVPQKQIPNLKNDCDIGVAISSTGELFHFRTGHHRLAIAQILNLSSVRVSVQLVHQNWLWSKGHARNGEGKDAGILSTIREKIREIDETTSGE